jgi:hypothetical protein
MKYMHQKWHSLGCITNIFKGNDFVTTCMNDVIWLGNTFGMVGFDLVKSEAIKTSLVDDICNESNMDCYIDSLSLINFILHKFFLQTPFI